MSPAPGSERDPIWDRIAKARAQREVSAIIIAEAADTADQQAVDIELITYREHRNELTAALNAAEERAAEAEFDGPKK